MADRLDLLFATEAGGTMAEVKGLCMPVYANTLVAAYKAECP